MTSDLLERLKNLTEADLVALLSQTSQQGEHRRSPAWRPQADLRPRPFDKDNPSPRFGTSSDGAFEAKPGYVSTRTAYPRLLFRVKKGTRGPEIDETTVRSGEAQAKAEAQGYSTVYPNIAPAPEPLPESIEQELAGLTDEERQMVFDAQRKSRLDRIQAKLAGLSEAELTALAPATPVKRGPGRPRKSADGGDGA